MKKSSHAQKEQNDQIKSALSGPHMVGEEWEVGMLALGAPINYMEGEIGVGTASRFSQPIAINVDISICLPNSSTFTSRFVFSKG